MYQRVTGCIVWKNVRNCRQHVSFHHILKLRINACFSKLVTSSTRMNHCFPHQKWTVTYQLEVLMLLFLTLGLQSISSNKCYVYAFGIPFYPITSLSCYVPVQTSTINSHLLHQNFYIFNFNSWLPIEPLDFLWWWLWILRQNEVLW